MSLNILNIWTAHCMLFPLAVLTFPRSVALRMVSLLAACTEDGERWACRMLLHVSILRFRRMRVWALFPVTLIWNKRETSAFELCIPRTSTDTASFSVQKQSYLCTDVLLVALHSWFVFVCSFFRRANLVWSMWPSIVLRPARLQHVWMMNEHVAACCSWFNVISRTPSLCQEVENMCLLSPTVACCCRGNIIRLPRYW